MAPGELGTYRQAAELVLSEAAGGRVWPRHVDAAVRKQETAGAAVTTLATLHKVGDALLQYQTESAPAPAPVAPPPAIVRASAAVAMPAPAVFAEPGFAPPAADINATSPGIAGGGDYTEAARALGHYVTALLVNIGGIVLWVFVAIGVVVSRADPLAVASLTPYLMIFSVVIVAWQAWAMFTYARHAPGITDSASNAKTAAVLIIITGAISAVSGFTSSPGEARGGLTLLGFLNGVLGLISILLVVSVCRKIASAFSDGRLEARGRTVNTLIGLTIGGLVLAFLMGSAGAGALVLLLLLAVLGLVIAAFVLYIMLLFGAKRLLTNSLKL